MSEIGFAFATRCVHAGEINDQYGAPHTPLYNTTTFKFGSTEKLLDVVEGRQAGFLYTRYGSNPSITSVEAKLASLEQAESALAFASGMAAISATLLSHGERGIVCIGEVYGGTWELMSSQLVSLGRRVEFVAANDEQALTNCLKQGIGLVYCETPSNPLLQVIDISRVAQLAHAYGALVAIDSTFATPVNQQPLLLGADITIHSATKYLGGHSDLTGGVVAGNKDVLGPLRNWRKNLGQCMAPETAQLLARSLATLEVRVIRQNTTALRLAQFLNEHAAIEQVYYPGLENFANHELAKRQMKGFGGMLSITLRSGAASAIRMVDALRLFSIAPSLGGVESLVSQPCLTSHRDFSPAMRVERGIGDNLIRLSIGLEEADDLERDLMQALSSMD
jgi:cystathionine gamma-synthase